MLTMPQVVKEWKVSRSYVQKAIKAGDLSASKDEKGRWIFDKSEVLRRKDLPKESAPAVAPVAVDHEPIIRVLHKQLEQANQQLQVKDDQLSVKDNQIENLQETMRDQMKLLEHEKKGFWSKLFS